MITTVYTQNIPIPWEAFTPMVDNHILAWYFSFRLRDGDELNRLREMYMCADHYCRNHVLRFAHEYSAFDVQRILKAGTIDNVWGWLDERSRHRFRTLLSEIVDSFYMINPSEKTPVIIAEHVPLPSVNIPWLHHYGFFPGDNIIPLIISDDVAAFKQLYTGEYTSHILRLVECLNAARIYGCIYALGVHIVSYSHQFASIYCCNDDYTLIRHIIHKSQSHLLYRLWKENVSTPVRDAIYDASMNIKSIDMIDMFLTEKNYMRVIIDAVQACGMYDSLYNLIVFKGIRAEWFAYYLRAEIDPIGVIPGHLLCKSTSMTLPRSIDDWRLLYNSMMTLRYQLERLQGKRAPPHIWPLLIGNAIMYDRNGSFLTSLVREHASEITQSMVQKMYTIYHMNKREGGWSSFVLSMRDLGVSPVALSL